MNIAEHATLCYGVSTVALNCRVTVLSHFPPLPRLSFTWSFKNAVLLRFSLRVESAKGSSIGEEGYTMDTFELRLASHTTTLATLP